VDRPVREGFLGELERARKDGIRYEEAASLRAQYIAGRGRNNYYRVYETKDGLIAVACLNNAQRRRMRDATGIDDPSVEGLRYDWFSEEVRQAHRATVEGYVAAFRSRTTAEWLAALDAADVPCGPVRFPEEIPDLPHVREQGLMLEIEHPVLGTLLMPACPVQMSETPAGTTLPPPALGQHGPAVLRELGYSDDDVSRLLDAGVLHTRERHLAGDG
jgi:formyl-CoA transferase